MAKTVPFPEYAPDISSLGTSISGLILNVVPRADGYGPFQSFVDFTLALPANCRGYFFARRADGSIAVFSGTSTDLYLLNNINFAWDKVSKGGVSYSALIPTANWRFAQFNELVVAVQVNTVPQKYTLNVGGNFADLGGSPPQAGQIAVVNRFLMLTELLSNPRRVHWSDLDGPEVWTAGVGLSDFQDLPDGGSAHGISGGDAYGVIFQDESIRTLTYAAGSAAIFQINRISTQDTLFAPYSVINAGTRTFFCSAQGFKVITAGGEPVPIGKERVDRFFFGDVDQSNLQLVIGATDPTATRVYWAYKSKSGQAGLFDKILCYDWSIGKNGQWSLLSVSGQYLAALAKPGLTLENLDAIAPGALQVLGAANNGSGAIRLTLNAVANGNFQIAGQNFIVVQGVQGVPNANGPWRVTIIDPTHIDLIGSTFAGAYTSGGAIGGSLDALPFSLDSISTAAVAQLSMIGPTGRAGFFSGANMEAIIETSEQDAEGPFIFIDTITPITDCSTVLGSIGVRKTPQESSVVYTPEMPVNDNGECPLTIEAKYARARLRMPAGAVWTYARGVQPNVQAAGEY